MGFAQLLYHTIPFPLLRVLGKQTFPFQGQIPTQKNWQSRIPDVVHDSLGPSPSSLSGALGRLREVGDSG